MIDPDRLRKLMFVGAFLLPIVVVVSVSTLFGGPSVASASSVTPVAASVAVPTLKSPGDRELTDTQKVAVKRIELLRSRAFAGSPMYHPASAEAPIEPVINVDTLDVTVAGIVEHRDKVYALIHEKWYRIGQSIGDSPWHVTAIDVNRRSVKFTNVETGEIRSAEVPGESLDD